MATKYDPEVLQTFADRLYRRTKWIGVWYGFLGFLAGVVLDGPFAVLLARDPHGGGPFAIGLFLLPLVGALVGYECGSSKAFHLRLEAQRTLCQLQIERNTRPSGSTTAESVG